ncbi:MAG: Two-component hybrid sensor and regulator [Oceanicaulis sp. HLUCCA04]|nr:MAG: Two-component hybrid sensor and regulator [Oceanicaulis sp. HLUCCA04]
MQAMSHTMSTHGFMPHGMCYLWEPSILWTHVLSDGVIALAYFSIPAALAIFSIRRPDLVYRPVLWLFVAFILLCGTTHLFSIWTVWNPQYQIEGLLKAATAAVSLATAVALWPLLPRALGMPSTVQLQRSNQALHSEIGRRDEAEARLMAVTGQLEHRVRQRTRDLERANAALRQFAAAAAHDLQAPLRHILIFSQLIEQEEAGQMSSDGQKHLSKVREGALRAQTLIRVLQEYAQLVNRLPQTETLELKQLMSGVASALEDEIEASGARLELGDLPEVEGDPVLLTQLFQNLVSNAIKYRSAQPPVITIQASNRDDGLVKISITDNGIGIDPAHSETIFEMMKRLHDGVRYPGMGVGLAFCREIVESHGGEIWLDETHLDGARFCLTLPVPGSLPAKGVTQ